MQMTSATIPGWAWAWTKRKTVDLCWIAYLVVWDGVGAQAFPLKGNPKQWSPPVTTVKKIRFPTVLRNRSQNRNRNRRNRIILTQEEPKLEPYPCSRFRFRFRLRFLLQKKYETKSTLTGHWLTHAWRWQKKKQESWLPAGIFIVKIT